MKARKETRRVGLVSLGCAKNLVDSERLLGQLKANNIEFVHDPADTRNLDSAVINTCGFIGDAKQESVDTILQFLEAKKQGAIREVFVMGCLSERYRDELRQELPDVDGIFGVNELRKIINRLGGNYMTNLVGDRIITTPLPYAYLKIAEGCDRSCSFCAIPAIRGGHISRSIEEIISEAESLTSLGVKEINLISQDTTYYGLDNYRTRKLPELLEKLAQTPGLEWLRLHYTYPEGFPEALFEVFRQNQNICRYLDIPLQHINNRILKSMRRGTNSANTHRLIERIRKELPGVAIRTTLIAGYPGETEKEFRELYDFVGSASFDRMGVFAYSHEEGTHACSLKDSVPEKVKMERVEALMSLQEEISFRLNQEKAGKEFKIVIDRLENDFYCGRTEFDSPEIDNEVLVESGKAELVPGNFYHVRIIKAESFDLFAELI